MGSAQPSATGSPDFLRVSVEVLSATVKMSVTFALPATTSSAFSLIFWTTVEKPGM